MPTEMRQIIFRQAEVARALVEYHRRRTLNFPTGSINHIEIGEEPEVRALVTIGPIGGGATEVVVAPQALAAALILFCINNKIPLPAESDKRLQKVGDGVALIVIKRHKTAEHLS